MRTLPGDPFLYEVLLRAKSCKVTYLTEMSTLYPYIMCHQEYFEEMIDGWDEKEENVIPTTSHLALATTRTPTPLDTSVGLSSKVQHIEIGNCKMTLILTS